MNHIYRSVRREGRIKSKLRAMLLAEGFDVTLWWEQQGDYRIHKYHWDLACWGCHAIPTDLTKPFVMDIACWSTMTECVRNGFTVDRHPRDGLTVNPKPSPR